MNSEVIEEIRALAKASDDELTPTLIVEAAQANPGSALYSEFERRGLWDDATAGGIARLTYARELIRRVKIQVVIPKPSGPKQVRVREFVAPMDPELPGRYIQITLTTEDEQARLLEIMRREWRALRTKWSSFEQFWSLVREDLN